MLTSISQTSPPLIEPITLAETKNHLRIEDSVSLDDSLVENLIVVARRYCESSLKMAIPEQGFTASFSQFPYAIPFSLESDLTGSSPLAIPNPPLVSVSSISYLDVAGDRQVWSSGSYEALTGFPGLVLPSVGQCYPSALCRPGSVQVTYTAGFASGQIPTPIKQACLLLCGLWYENRASTTEARMQAIPFGIDALLGSENWGSL